MVSGRPVTRRQLLDLLHRGQSLAWADLRGMDLSGIAFDGANLQHAKLGTCNLARASFRGADLQGCSLWQADCKETVFDGANLEEADLDLTNLDGTTFRGARIRRAIFPNGRQSIPEIEASVRTGRPVRILRAAGE